VHNKHWYLWYYDVETRTEARTGGMVNFRFLKYLSLFNENIYMYSGHCQCFILSCTKNGFNENRL